MSLFCVFDGHGGDEAAKFCSQALPSVLAEELKRGQDPVHALHNAFCRTDARFTDKIQYERRNRNNTTTSSSYGFGFGSGGGGGTNVESSGTTCVCVLLDAQGRMYCANVGDSRAVVGRRSSDANFLSKGNGFRYTAIPLTNDHKASSAEAVALAASEGGFVANGRIMGQLAVGRALGDVQFKLEGHRVLSCEPEIQQMQLTPEVRCQT